MSVYIYIYIYINCPSGLPATVPKLGNRQNRLWKVCVSFGSKRYHWALSLYSGWKKVPNLGQT